MSALMAWVWHNSLTCTLVTTKPMCWHVSTAPSMAVVAKSTHLMVQFGHARLGSGMPPAVRRRRLPTGALVAPPSVLVFGPGRMSCAVSAAMLGWNLGWQTAASQTACAIVHCQLDAVKNSRKGPQQVAHLQAQRLRCPAKQRSDGAVLFDNAKMNCAGLAAEKRYRAGPGRVPSRQARWLAPSATWSQAGTPCRVSAAG